MKKGKGTGWCKGLCLQGVGGAVELADGYLPAAYAAVRAAGGHGRVTLMDSWIDGCPLFRCLSAPWSLIAP